jgi:WD repeat-containing protein 35
MSSFRVFLSKKMKFSSDNPMTEMTWSRANGLIAGGYSDGKVTLFSVTQSRENPGSVAVETAQVLEEHRRKITTLCWSENGKQLGSGDSSGKIAFYTKRERGWRNTVANDSVQSKVNAIAFSKNSKFAAIAYQDGTCACVSIDGNLNWSKMMSQVVEFVEWSPNSKVLLCGTSYGEVLIVDQRGVEVGKVPLPCNLKSKTEPRIAKIEWHKRADYGLLIAFEGGTAQLMRNESDSQPFIINMDVEVSSVSWFKSGTAFVVAGTKSNGKSVALFFTNHGDRIRELEILGRDIHAISLDPSDTTLAIANDNHFCLAQIVPSIFWAYTKNTLLYFYAKNNDDVYTAIFFNRKSMEKRLQTYRNVLAVTGHNGNFAIATKIGPEEALITITNTIGVTTATTRINMLPFSASSYGDVVAFVSEKKVCIWRFTEEEPQILDFTEKVNCVLLREKLLYLSTGQQIVVLDIPSLTEVVRHTVNISGVETIGASIDGSILSIIDTYGTLQFFSTSDSRIVGPVGREAWNSAWSADSPTQFASLERQKLMVYNELEPEDGVPCLSHIAEFTELEIITADLISLLKDPMNPTPRYFRSHPTKQLRQLRRMLSARPETTLDDIFAFAKQEGKAKLWDELAETAMLEMNFSFCERCFLETTNYKGLQFVKRIRTVKDPNIQRAQVLSYLGKFDEAESIYMSMDRTDLAVEMRTSIGDFHHVIRIIGNGVGDDETIAEAYTAVGDEFSENARWQEAAEAYAQAKNNEKQMIALFLDNDFEGLERLMLALPQQSPLLKTIGEMFVAIGAVDDAVTAFTSIGEIGLAIDACARMNHWKPALKLAGKGKNNEIRARMISYAQTLIDNGQRAAAVDFYVRAGLYVETAKLLLKEGDDIMKIGEDFISAKMCYVFAGLQLEQHRKGAFDGAATADERLDGLMKEDEVTTSGLHREIWRKAEGVHFLLLANKFAAKAQWREALYCSCRVFDDYSDVVGEVRAAALLAYCGYKNKFYGQCSRALTTLEHSDECTQKQREQFEELAIDIFTKSTPTDPDHVDVVSCPKCTAIVSMLQSQCPECGERIRVCSCTGRLIDGADFWECNTCKHSVHIDVADSLTICPLCHHTVTP